ncbi:MAG: S-layer homology domain-containing protein, partial [Oscillospiraceae bacterium]
DRGISGKPTKYLPQIPIGQNEKVPIRIKINPVSNRMSVWVKDMTTPVVDNKFTRQQISNIENMDVFVEKTGSLAIDNLKFSTNKGLLLEELFATGAYYSGFQKDSYITDDVLLNTPSISNTTAVWATSNAEALTIDGKKGNVSVNTPIVLTLTLTDKANADVSITKEIPVIIAAIKAGNVARGKTVSSNDSGTGDKKAENAVDGLQHTMWFTARGIKNPYIIVDLGGVEFINTVRVLEADNKGENIVNAYEIQVSEDNKTWQTVYSGKKTTADEISVGATKARYVKYLVTDKNNGNTGLKEFEILFRANDVEKARAEMQLLKIDAPYELTEDIATDKIPTVGKYGSAISWKSTNENALTATGKVTRQGGNVKVALVPSIIVDGKEVIGEVKNFLVKGTNSGTQGGGGSGGGGSSSSGGNSGGSVATPNTPTEVTPTEAFSDVSKNFWAEKYITELALQNIVSGNGNGKFEPERSVNREEFLKMLLTALKIDVKKYANVAFGDVETSQWYYPYVAKAHELGIVNGISQDEFGIGMPISRQDMTVMTVKALTVAHKSFENVNEIMTFSDESQISDYAKESVSKLQQYGIVNGNENGEFNPLSNLTRAESAKIIYSTID